MSLLRQETAVQSLPQPQRSCAPYLLLVLLFQVCVLLGILVSPYLRARETGSPAGAGGLFSQVVRWRQSVCDPTRDPRLGDPAPPLHLSTATGQPYEGAALEGKKVVLLFVQDGGG